jgi:site-specific DNA-methyltransferase (adenine-specific)
MGYLILPGDAKGSLKTLPDNSVDSFVMDPPYDLVSIQKRFGGANAAPAKFGTDGVFARSSRGFMGKTWDGTGIAFDPEFWAEVVRVLKPGGHVAAFGGSRTYHRMAVAMEDAGLEIRDSLFWVYGSGFPKSHDIQKSLQMALGRPRKRGRAYIYTMGPIPEAEAWDGWGTALKPAQEPIVLARKPISESSVAANVLRWGTGAINIASTRVGNQIMTEGRMTQRPGGVLNANGRDVEHGNWKQKPNDTPRQYVGRWPANVLLTCCGMVPHRPGCPILELDRQSGVTKSGGGNKNVANRMNGITIGNGLGKGNGFGIGGDSGGASRYFPNLDFDADLDDLVPFFYSAKASRTERDLGLGDLEPKAAHELVDRKPGAAGLNSPRAGAGRTSGGRNTHPTVKPLKVMEWLIRLITPPGGVVVDCFMGSGTTGMGAVLNGFDFIGMELTDEYIPIAQGRIAWAAKRKAQIDASPVQATIFDELNGGDDEGGSDHGIAGGDAGTEYSAEPERGNVPVRAQETLDRPYQLPIPEGTGDDQDLPDHRLVEESESGEENRPEHGPAMGNGRPEPDEVGIGI